MGLKSHLGGKRRSERKRLDSKCLTVRRGLTRGEKGKGLIPSLLVIVLLPTISSNFLLPTFEKQC